MKFNRKFIAFVIALITIANFSIVGSIPTFAHEAILDVTYDTCVIDENKYDGIDEMWYVLGNNFDMEYRHISHQETTIKYFFEDDPDRGGCWTVGGISASEAELIKAAFNFRR